MLQQNGQQNEPRKYTAKEWEEMKPEIARLYNSGSLESVVKSIREEHGFDAT
jgi:hypothetical protein